MVDKGTALSPSINRVAKTVSFGGRTIMGVTPPAAASAEDEESEDSCMEESDLAESGQQHADPCLDEADVALEMDGGTLEMDVTLSPDSAKRKKKKKKKKEVLPDN